MLVSRIQSIWLYPLSSGICMLSSAHCVCCSDNVKMHPSVTDHKVVASLTYLAWPHIRLELGLRHWHWCRRSGSILSVRAVHNCGSAGERILLKQSLSAACSRYSQTMNQHNLSKSSQMTIHTSFCDAAACFGLGTGKVKSSSLDWSVIYSTIFE